MAMNLQSLFATQDLTKGKPIHGIIRFAIPLLIGNLAQQLYNTVDSIVVGKYVGTDVTLEKKDYKFVKQDDILAVVTE